MSVHQIVLTDFDTNDAEFALTLGLVDSDAGNGEPIVYLTPVSMAESTSETQHVALAPAFGVYVDDLLGSLSLLSDEWRFTRVPVAAAAPADAEDVIRLERCPKGGAAARPTDPCFQWHHHSTIPDGTSPARWYHLNPEALR